MTNPAKLTIDNFTSCALRFQDRQAGISVIFDPTEHLYTYNAYCLELKLLKEIFSVECDFLEDALDIIHSEFGTWELYEFEEKSGCGSCAAR